MQIELEAILVERCPGEEADPSFDLRAGVSIFVDTAAQMNSLSSILVPLFGSLDN